MSEEKEFKFDLRQSVVLDGSNISAKVIGRAEYVSDEDRYFLRYVDGNGSATEAWWAESALRAS